MPGTVSSVITNWNDDGEKSGAPYVVDRDGTVFDVFPDTDWAYHLHIPGSRGAYDKDSVAITLANEGGLQKKGSQFFAFNSTHHQSEYLGEAFELDFRGATHWAELNKPQVDSLIELTLEVCKKHKITPKFFNSLEFNPKVWEKATIFRHINCSKTATDLPLNDWVIEKIKAAGIEVVTPQT